MRNSIIALAAAGLLAGCSGSSNSSSSGSTGGSTTSTGSSSSGSTTSTGSSSGSSTTTTGSSSGSSGTTTTGSSSGSSTSSTGSSGSTGSTGSFCTPSSSSGSSGNDWTCLGQVPVPTPATATAQLQLTLSDRSNHPLMGVPVKLCERADVTCATPDATGITDQTGKVTLAAPLTLPDAGASAFTGYLDMASADAGPGSGSGNFTWPQLAFAPPIAADQAISLVGVTNDDVSLLGVFLGNIDPAQGDVVGQVADCMGNPGQGVVVGSDLADADGGTGVYYFNGQFPSATGPTDSSGQFIITNVPAGAPNVMGALSDTCAPVATIPVRTRAGTITTVVMGPQ